MFRKTNHNFSRNVSIVIVNNVNHVKMEYKKKRFSLYNQKRITLIVQETKKKYEEEKKKTDINKAIWIEKRKKWVYLFTQTGYI